MKFRFLAAVMLLTAHAVCQTATVVDSGGDYDAQIRSAFQLVNYAGAATGKLIERAPSLINLLDYNGSRLADSLTMNFDKFSAMYLMISSASFTGSPGLPDPGSVYNNGTTASGASAIFLLAQRYNQFDPASAAQGRITQFFGNALYTAGNVYLEDTLFAAAIQDTVFKTGTSSFILPAANILSNFGTAPAQNMTIDWGDGMGALPYAVGQTVSVNYAAAGIKTVVISYTQLNGKILKTQFAVQVVALQNSVRRPTIDGYGFDATHHITIPVTASRSYLGVANSVDVDIFFACDDQKIRKPLIILDGFEPRNFNSVDFTSIITTLKGYINSPTGMPLDHDFQTAGYDLIFVDWDRVNNNQGRDYIQRNAYLLESILQKVNDMKRANGSGEQNVVIGFSMGGVIGKYALLDMEKNNPTAVNGGHDVRLFIGWDAPLKGANINLGLQHFLKHWGNYKFIAHPLREWNHKLQLAMDLIQSPAASQMLIYQAFDDANQFAPAAHVNFQNELEHLGLNSDGVLQKCVFKAIVNGSLTGKTQFNPGDFMYGGYGNLWDILKVANLNSSSAIQIFNYFYSFNASCAINALPAQGASGYVYTGSFINKWKIGFISLTVSNNHNVLVSGAKPLDTAPGGMTSLGNDQLPAFFKQNHTSFCFIPTISSLELQGAAANDVLSSVGNTQTVLAQGITNVKFYEGSRSDAQSDNAIGINTSSSTGKNPHMSGPDNQEHVSFSYRNTAFLLNELMTSNGLSQLPNGVLDGRTYNFALNAGNLNPVNVNPVINFNLTLQNSAKLWVNRLDKINFLDLNGPQNTVNTGYQLTVGGASSGCASSTGAIININNTSEMRIGDARSSTNNPGTVDVIQSGEIDVNQGGQLVTENSSNIIVENGGVLNINNGGFACAMWGAKITVKAGGTVHVFNGGTLRISEYSALILQDGGQLILDQTATLQLWDGQAPNGQATVWVKNGGNLVVNGSFTFSGNGFFQFDYGNKVTLTADWTLKGYDKAHRLIRLNSPQAPAVITMLDVSGHSFTLSDCLVTSDGNTDLYVHNANTVLISNVAFQGTNQTIGLWVDNNDHTIVTGCDFTGLKIGVLATNHSNYYNVLYTHFSNCIYGISGTNAPNNSCCVVGCTFDGYTSQTSAGEIVAVSLSNVSKNVMNSTVITGSTTLGATHPVIGVRILNSKFLNMNGSVIQNCATGIDAMNGYNNIYMAKGSAIQNCTVGVAMNGQINSPDGMNSGLFSMDCSALVGNGTGVYGNDVLFAIDETVNSGGLNANYFSSNVTNQLFDVCYVSRNNITTILARHNYWQRLLLGTCTSEQVAGTGSSLWLTTSNDFCHSNSGTAITLDRSGIAATRSDLTKCSFTQVAPPACATGPGVFSLSASTETTEYAVRQSAGSRAGLAATSVVIDGVGRDLAPQYLAANAALEKMDLTEAERLFGPMARIPDAARKAATPEARLMIDVARIFSRRGAGATSADAYNWAEGTAVAKPVPADAGTMAIYPNPAENNFRINLPAGAYAVRVFNAVGVLVGTANAESGLDMDTRQWVNGLYTVEAVNAATREHYRGKLTIQK